MSLLKLILKMYKINSFKGKYNWLSNFYPVSIEYDNITYPSVEHYYVAMKTQNLDERFKISKLENAGEAKSYGKDLDIRGDWEDIRVQIMKYGLEEKFKQEPFRSLLIDTDGAYLEEGNAWNDMFWGVCKGTGKNVLGKLIMDIRKNL